MLELLQPNKEKVGERLKQIKDELGVSFTELGNRLGLGKSTLSSYVQGYNLAPIEVLEKIAKISGRTLGWLCFGEMKEYIKDYLILIGRGELIELYPEVVEQIEDDFLMGVFDNSGWENDFGYPTEEFIDDSFWCFYTDVVECCSDESVLSEQMNSIKLESLAKEKEKNALVIICVVINGSIVEGWELNV